MLEYILKNKKTNDLVTFDGLLQKTKLCGEYIDDGVPVLVLVGVEEQAVRADAVPHEPTHLHKEN